MQKILLLSILYFLISHSIFGQENGKCISIFKNDSLYKLANNNGFDFTIEEDNSKPGVPKNKQLFYLENGILKFKIGTGPGDKKMALVTNAVLTTDSKGKKFYYIKLLFKNDLGQEQQMALRIIRSLCFDVSSLLAKNDVDYLKFYGEQEEILCKKTTTANYFPFLISDQGDRFAITAEIESVDLYPKYFNFFEKNGYSGNGYCWEGHIKQILTKLNPDLLKHITFDPEAGAFFAYADTKENQLKFVNLLSPIFADMNKLEPYVKKADRSKISD